MQRKIKIIFKVSKPKKNFVVTLSLSFIFSQQTLHLCGSPLNVFLLIHDDMGMIADIHPSR